MGVARSRSIGHASLGLPLISDADRPGGSQIAGQLVWALCCSCGACQHADLPHGPIAMNLANATATALWLCAAPLSCVEAHERWSNSEPIPAWVKEQCCGPTDVHHLRPDQVHLTADGYLLDGYRALINESHLTPSPDGEWWVFYRDYPDGSQSAVYCFFGPIQGS